MEEKIEPENPEMERLKKEIRRLREIMAGLAEEINAADKVLAPVWSLEAMLQDEIKDTLPWSFAGIDARVIPFARLLHIAVVWGHQKTERRELQRRMDAYAREAKSLSQQLKKLKPVKAKPQPPQGELF